MMLYAVIGCDKKWQKNNTGRKIHSKVKMQEAFLSNWKFSNIDVKMFKILFKLLKGYIVNNNSKEEIQ